MITGFDTVLIAAGPAGPAVTRLLNQWARHWTDMRVALVDHDDSGFREWSSTRQDLPQRQGTILVARDDDMVADWDEHGYKIPDSPEGPFSLLYEPCPARVFSALVKEDPYARNGRFEPYDAAIVGHNLTLVTIVTPDEQSDYSRSIIDAAVSALAGE
ncbi:hypothetical protein FNH05_24685 [Amycolatopsis rhizosphaerae]|uniref:FAD/NAD(P)-binding protein n=1 Tax=Amycolatopsis rhizosphaerae TaxID=2053003 RepID=A0A558BNF2_9PSEU|nr:hypothetical protein [Amycolatopsis rhizosphaerae]TVT38045.1 hypothetical protein FNH05_24685 [Amycolatopsis rhizosphaerae]